MKTPSSFASDRRRWAFTLIELLVVISIIGILAGLLLPAVHKATTAAKIKIAKVDMSNLASAISLYESAYSRLPAPSIGANDATFGYGTNVSNADIMVILMDEPIGPNKGHQKNPQQTAFFKPSKVNSDPISANGLGTPGLSTVDHQFRDPWGRPYVITLDLDLDGYCRDALYGQQGANGLVKVNGIYLLKGSVMIWSSGPDKNPNTTKDNVLGWK